MLEVKSNMLRKRRYVERIELSSVSINPSHILERRVATSICRTSFLITNAGGYFHNSMLGVTARADYKRESQGRMRVRHTSTFSRYQSYQFEPEEVYFLKYYHFLSIKTSIPENCTLVCPISSFFSAGLHQTNPKTKKTL